MTAATSRLRRRGIGAGVAALVGLTGLGFAAVPAQAAPGFDPTSSTSRVAGADRFETAAKAATAAFPGGASTVILANGYRSIDALSANYVAGVKSAPILLTDTNTVPASTLAAITTLKAKNVIIFGDDNSVSATAQAQLTAAGLTITDTVAGDDRYETAADAYTQGATESKTVFLARGDFYGTDQVAADALAAGPLAYKGTPILLTAADSLPASTAAALKAGGVTKVVYLGTGISDTVKAAVTAAVPGVSTEVIGGADRTSTAELLAESSYGKAVYNTTTAALANGYKVDALAAGPWAAIKGTPILLTYGTDALGDGTTKYLTDHAATLTSATVFGDTASVPAALATGAKTTGGGDVSSQVVTAVGSSSFTYADATTKTAVTATYSSTDKFTVDGTAASQGVFAGALSVGDTIVVSPNTPSTGVTTYALTNVDPTKAYVSGLVTGFTGSPVSAVSVGSPITGTALNTVSNLVSSSTYTVYTVDGASATATQFAAAINVGDSIAFSGTGADALNVRTVALTNGTVTGTVTGRTSTTFSVKTAAGATLGPFTPTASDTLTSDGTAAASLAAFNGAVSNGDTVTYSRTAGLQTVALTNAASTPYTGIVPAGETASALSVYVGDASTPTTAFDAASAGSKLTIDGALATVSEFNAALTAGDQLTITQPDGAIDTVGSVALTNKTLSGTVGSVNVSGTTFSVLSSGKAALATGLNYSSATVYPGNLTTTYFVNGTSQTLAQFNSALALVANGTNTAAVELADNGTVTEYRLTTASNSASPAVSGLSTPASGDTSLTLKFNKPVTYGTFAASDFTITKQTGSATPVAVVPTAASISGGGFGTAVSITVPSVTTGDVYSVTLTTTGAAKVLDVTGTTPAVATVTATVS